MEVTLGEAELWKEFDKQRNEMIITKIGRNLFPILEFDFKGLHEHTEYQIGVTMHPLTGFKLKWSRGRWEPLEVVEEMFQPNEVVQPAKTGRELMNRGLKLDKLKLTNSRDAQMKNDQMIRVQSMKQYIPILNVYEVRPIGGVHLVRQFQFPETKFIAVTAYQNERVKQLKVQRNKFAQGFREGTRTATKRPNSTSTLPDSPNSTSSSDASEVNATGGQLLEMKKTRMGDVFGDGYQMNGTMFGGAPEISPTTGGVSNFDPNWSSHAVSHPFSSSTSMAHPHSHPLPSSSSTSSINFQQLSIPAENSAAHSHNYQNFQFNPDWSNFYNQQGFPQQQQPQHQHPYDYSNQFAWHQSWTG